MVHIDGKNGIHLSRDQLLEFRECGIVYIKNFYDFKSEILPIQKDIYRLIELIIKENRLPIQQKVFTYEFFDSGLIELVKEYRNLAGILYDAVKKLPSYVRLSNCSKHEQLARLLLNSDFVAFANRGYGIRMDHPNDDSFLTQWHQDYVSQLGSLKGVVFWSPLRDVNMNVGPVVLCPGSHREGIFPIVRDGPGSYGLKIKDEEALSKKYLSITPEVKVGDLVAIDYLTLHRSSPNRSSVTRWAMISRYFDFLERGGISNGWRGGLQEGNSFENVHPELFGI